MDKYLNRKKVVLVGQKRTSRWLANELGRDERTVSKWCTNKVQPYTGGNVCYSQSSKCASTRFAN